jgi:hypothetical protein
MVDRKRISEKMAGFVLFDMMITFAALIFSIFICISLLPHKETDDSSMAGQICVELYWDNNRNIDLDLWAADPADPKNSIGYSNMHGIGMDLMRDVIGFAYNPEHVNMEIACGNKLYPGEYTFDVNYYSNHEHSKDELNSGADASIDATMIVRIKDKNNYSKQMRTTYHLTHEGQDKTMFNFKIDNNGHVIQESINSRDKFISNNRGPSVNG